MCAFHIYMNHCLWLSPGACRHIVQPALYEHAHYHNPCAVHYWLNNFGKTSYQQRQQTFSTTTKQLLFEDQIFNVFVDISTRLPTPLTDDFKASLTTPSDLCDMPSPPVVLSKKPAETLQRSYHTHWSHVDYFKHTNQSQYVKFMFDAACDMSMSGELTQFQGDLAERRLEVIEVIYKSETTPNQKLTIHCWEEEGSKLNFQIEKENGGSVVQGAFKYAAV